MRFGTNMSQIDIIPNTYYIYVIELGKLGINCFSTVSCFWVGGCLAAASRTGLRQVIAMVSWTLGSAAAERHGMTAVLPSGYVKIAIENGHL